MKRLIRILLPPLVLLGGIAIAASLITTGPEAKRRRRQAILPTVEIMTLQRQDYQIMIASRGILTPRTSTTLVPEVAGKIIQVADNFHNGGFFSEGDLLLQIDPNDYEIALTIAQAELVQKELALAEEEALSNQASSNWAKLQLDGTPSPLTLRTPYLKNAQAALAAARARVKQARIELKRTRVTAPYSGRILEKKVDLGQYISPGTPLVEIYASDTVEIRLPISTEVQRFLNLPEENQHSKQTAEAGTLVLFSSKSDIHKNTWQGRLVRTEGTIDVQSRQLFVVSQIENPYQREINRPPLIIGQFLEAQILGKQLKDVFVIPREAVRGAKTVHLIDSENRLQRRELEVIWRDEQHLIASGPLQSGERISLTALPFAAEGIKVQIAGEKVTGKPEKRRQEH